MKLLKKMFGGKTTTPEDLLEELEKMRFNLPEDNKEDGLTADLNVLLEESDRPDEEKRKCSSLALHYLATIRFLRGDYEKGFQALEKGLEEDLFAMDPNEHLAHINAIKSQGLWDKAVFYGELLKAKYKENNLPDCEMVICGELGQIYKRQGEVDKAFENANRGYDLAESLEDTQELAAFTLDIANLHLYKQNYEGAIEWAHKVLEMMKDEPGNQRGYGVLAATYKNSGDLAKAEEYARLGLEQAIEYKSPESEAAFRMNLCEIYAETDKFQEALEQGKKAAELSEEANNMERVFMAQGLVLDVAGKSKNLEDFFTYLLRQIIMLDGVDPSVSSMFFGGVWDALSCTIPELAPDDISGGMTFVFSTCKDYIEKNDEAGDYIRFFTELCMMIGLWYADRHKDAFTVAARLDEASGGEMGIVAFLQKLPGGG